MGLTKSSYYRQPKQAANQLKMDMDLREKIEEIHLTFPGYGYRRVRRHLLREGICVNAKRIRRVMKKYELFSCLKKWLRFSARFRFLTGEYLHPNRPRSSTLSLHCASGRELAGSVLHGVQIIPKSRFTP
jgi:hypothetical protein